jgi:hypothetical protein
MAPTEVRLDIVERLNTGLRRIIHQLDTEKQRARVGIDAVTSTIAKYHTFVKCRHRALDNVVREAKSARINQGQAVVSRAASA